MNVDTILADPHTATELPAGAIPDPMNCRWSSSPTQHRGPIDGCWEWTGFTNSEGYGRARVPGTNQTGLVHRLVFEAIYGWLPKFVLHSCDNPPCFRPDHLFAGDHTANMADMVAKKRQSYGSKHYNARLTPDDVVEIRRCGEFETRQALALRFGVSRTAIRDVLSYKNWRSVA